MLLKHFRRVVVESPPYLGISANLENYLALEELALREQVLPPAALPPLPPPAAAAATAAVATSEIWVPALAIGLIVLIVIFIVILPGSTTQLSSNIAPVDGQGGGTYSGSVTFACKPDDPGCPQSLCSGCKWPVKCGYITQCPGDSYSHSRSNAVDFGVSGCSPENLGAYSQFSGVITTVLMQFTDGLVIKAAPLVMVMVIMSTSPLLTPQRATHILPDMDI
jgi:hypothetical protein